MAPRSAKAKKATDVKVTEQDAPKKGRGKGKNVVEPTADDDGEILLDDKSSTDSQIKVGKRAKKAVNEEQNDKDSDVAPPAKKGRKKKVKDVEPEEKEPSNDEQSADESSGQPEEDNDDNVSTNGHIEETQTSARGKKKQSKKETVTEKPEQRSGRVRKNAKQEVVEDDKKEVVEEKPKPSGKGRGRKPTKTEVEPEDRSVEEEEEKEKNVPKGRKRAPVKSVPEKEQSDEDDIAEAEEEEREPKKKEPKGKRGKKALTKEDSDDEDEVMPSSKKRKFLKKEEKSKDEEEEVLEIKPVKGKRGQKKATETSTDTKRKAADEKATGDTKQKAPPKNKSATDFETLDFSNTTENSVGKQWNFKISSWNVDGIRAWLSKGGLDYLKYEKPDILCLQEVKCTQEKLPSELTSVPGYHAYWLASDTDGYAGVGIYTTKLAMNVVYGLQNKELDAEGRIITAEYEQFYLVCTYVPNSGRKLVTLPKRLHWNEEFCKYVKELDKKKPVIICGDMNVSHNEIDLANPKTNRKNAGFTDEEREGMTELLGEGFIDTYRHLYPEKTGAYTFWTYMSNSRARNVGWRLDYFIISEKLLPALCDNVIRDGVYGSDHCPVSLFLHLSSADKPKE